jgi:hypothetical protein
MARRPRPLIGALSFSLAIALANTASSQNPRGILSSPDLATIPPLPVHPPILMLNFPNQDSGMVIAQPTAKQILEAGASVHEEPSHWIVFVLCDEQADGSLGACKVTSEYPNGKGLGDIGLRLSKLIRLKTEDQFGHPKVGHAVNARFSNQGPLPGQSLTP